MGVAIAGAGFHEDAASGAQVIDGGLRFDSRKSQRLTRTPSSAGNRKTWTWSAWVKTVPGAFSASNHKNLFSVDGGGADATRMHMFIGNASDKLQHDLHASSPRVSSSVYRDVSGWYHVVVKFDSTQSTARNQIAWYINGQQVVNWDTESTLTQNNDFGINGAYLHAIGSNLAAGPGQFFDGLMSQVYLIDGQALDPSYFGFTDPLTNTWRPKKLSSSIAFGTNGFYLPFDGNSPIGKDMSGKGNDWTPVNFGGSNTIEKATGALPILNTDGGGKVARVGVRTDSNASSLVLALPLVGNKSDFSNRVNGGTTEKVTSVTTSSFSSVDSIFYGGSLSMGGGYVTVTDSSDFNFGTGSYTVECWVNVTSGGNAGFVGKWYAGSQGTTNSWLLYKGSDGALYWVISSNGTNSTGYTTAASTVPTNKWVHCAACYDASTTTLRLFIDGVLAKTESSPNTPATVSRNVTIGRWDIGDGTWSGYIQDVRIYKGVAKYTQNFIPASTDPDILPDTPSGVAYSSNVALVPSTDGAVALDGSGDYLSISSPSADIINWYSTDYTLEYFIYANAFGSSANSGSNVLGNANTSDTSEYWSFGPKSGGTVTFYYWSGAQNSFSTTTALSTGRWHHLAFVKNSTSLKIYIDGVESASTTLSVSPQSGSEYPFLIGKVTNAAEFNGIISNVHVVKGTALYTSNFTPPTAPISSVANTKLLCCKSQTSATASDVTPGTITATNAVATNFNPFTVNINTQRGQESGYATMNPLAPSGGTFSNGNLDWASPATDQRIALSSISISTSGKWYCEYTIGSKTGTYWSVGIFGNPATWSPRRQYRSDGPLFDDSSQIATFSSFTQGDVMGLTFDSSTSVVSFYKNGILQGTTTASPTAATTSYYFGCTSDSSGGSMNYSANFGQKPFKFPPPAGFQPLALANTPRPTIVRPDQYVGIVTYSGNSAARSLSVGFKPDLVWIKARSSDSAHHIFDSVRGPGKRLISNGTQDDTYNASDSLTGFISQGFTLGADSTTGCVNTPTNTTYVAWCWRAGGNSNTYNINDIGYSTASAAGLASGTITPTGASINTKSGFSIITYTGTGSAATISHGLTKAPAFMIFKNRTDADDWAVYHTSITNDYYLNLNSTAAQSNSVNMWNDTDPTSTVFSLGAATGSNAVNRVNNTGRNYVAYLWAEIPGFSKFGSYSGGTNPGFISCGFKPAFLMIKGSLTSNWVILDNQRDKYNTMTQKLYADVAGAENVSNPAGDSAGSNNIDFVSNGFVLRSTNTWTNGSGNTYIYAAFAETPNFNLYGGQSNAR